MNKNLESLGINANGKTRGELRAACPFCKDKHERHAKRKCLAVNLDNGTYFCHRCGAKGRLEGYENMTHATKEQTKPVWQKPIWHAEFVNANSDALNYLVKERHLGADTLQAMKVSEPWVKMPQRDDVEDQPVGVVSAVQTVGHEEGMSAGKADEDNKLVPTTEPAVLPKKVGELEQVIAFNYFLEGELVNIKYRSTDKRFLSFKGGRVIPYNIDSVKGKTVCAITEGEIDALTLHHCGIKSVVSVPTGGNSRLTWMDDFWNTHFADKMLFILALDADKVGQQLQDALVKRLGEAKCRIVKWSKDCKDANEQLCKHGVKSVVSRIERGVHPLMENVYTANDLEGELKDVFHNRIQHGKKIGLQGFDDLVSFEPGRLIIESGRPGDGKSELADEIIVRLNLLHGWKTAFFSPENVPIALHLRKLAEKITGYRFEPSTEMNDGMFNAVQRWLSNNIFHILPREDCYELDTILETTRMLVERKGIKVLVIDPFNRIEQRLSLGQTELQYISSILNKLIRFAQQMEVMVLLVAHPRKVNRNSTDGRARRVEMNDINGSADFGNKADICMIVDRNDESGVTTVHVDKVRFKHLGKRGMCHFHYEIINGRFNPCGVGQAATRNGDVITRYANVKWQTRPWIMSDGTLVPPLLHETLNAAPKDGTDAPPYPVAPIQSAIPF